MHGRTPASPHGPSSRGPRRAFRARGFRAALLSLLALSAALPRAGFAQTITRSLTLGSTAPGNDGSVGTASAYSVRYGTSPLSEANWSAATVLPGAPTPGPAGTAQSLSAGGFSPGVTYYFGIKTVDGAGNWSALGNV